MFSVAAVKLGRVFWFLLATLFGAPGRKQHAQNISPPTDFLIFISLSFFLLVLRCAFVFPDFCATAPVVVVVINGTSSRRAASFVAWMLFGILFFCLSSHLLSFFFNLETYFTFYFLCPAHSLDLLWFIQPFGRPFGLDASHEIKKGARKNRVVDLFLVKWWNDSWG